MSRTTKGPSIFNGDLAVIGNQIEEVLKKIEHIPVLVVSYNNGSYVSNMVRQLNTLGITPIVLDNKSDDRETVNILNTIKTSDQAHVFFAKKNHGHMIGFREPIYKKLPQHFAYTDPDLLLNSELPADFLSVLSKLTETMCVFKAGMALPLQVNDLIAATENQHHLTRRRPFIFKRVYSVNEWEESFWTQRLRHELEIYGAPVDTTFAVYNKRMFRGDFLRGIRVAGAYSAIHLPWFPTLDIMAPEQRKKYLQDNISSTWNIKA